jgi:phosphoglucosamine mutase
VLCDEFGQTVDGDQVMALIAKAWHDNGTLRGDGVVATVMSNLGLERFLAGRGLALHRTNVGDRYVLERMRRDGFNLGGEQSGHVILSDYSTTGDGLVAALQVLAALVVAQKPASRVLRLFEPLPQLLKNVRLPEGMQRPVMEEEGVRKVIAAAESELAGTGRLLIRKSGTEPLIRVMAEGEDERQIDRVVDEVVTAIRAVAGS